MNTPRKRTGGRFSGPAMNPAHTDRAMPATGPAHMDRGNPDTQPVTPGRGKPTTNPVSSGSGGYTPTPRPSTTNPRGKSPAQGYTDFFNSNSKVPTETSNGAIDRDTTDDTPNPRTAALKRRLMKAKKKG